jgi:hypothetical protein
MKYEIKGIKCDNVKCSFEDNSVKDTDYSKWLNKPCPNCGCNLLTQKDYDTVLLMKKMADSKVIKAIEYVCRLFGDKDKTINVEMNGSGKIITKEDLK